MKYFALVVLLAAVVTALPPQSRNDIQPRHVHHTYTYTTLLDHFNPQNYVEVNFVSTKSVNTSVGCQNYGVLSIQTYTEQKDYFRPGGPIYIYIQDNGVLTTDLLDTGVMHDLAEETGAVLITASNRYFRDNLPTP